MSSRARYFAASALVAPTRARCITPSGMIASGSPLCELNSSTSPTYRLPGAAGTLTRRIPVPVSGKVRISEFMRTAPTPSLGITPSIDLSA